MQLSVFVAPKDFNTSFRFTVGGDGPYEILPAPIVSERQGWRGGKGPDCHTGMIYSREGMRHQCWSLVIVITERGRQVGDIVLHHGLPRSRGVTSVPARSW